MHVIGPELGLDAAGHDHRLRRQPHQHARRLRRARLRHRHERGRRTCSRRSACCSASRRRSRSTVEGALAAGVGARTSCSPSSARIGIGGGTRAGHRIPGRGDPRAVDGRAHDGLQHVDRGGRARRHDRARRDDVRVPARAAARAAGRRWDARGRALARSCRPTRARPSTARSRFDAAAIEPMITYGTNPGMGDADRRRDPERRRRQCMRKALRYMGLEAGQPLLGQARRRRVHRQLHERAAVRPARRGRACCAAAQGRARRAHAGRARLAADQAEAEAEGLDRVFLDAGAEWREAGCSMCIAMNGDSRRPASTRSAPATATSRAARGRAGARSSRAR